MAMEKNMLTRLLSMTFKKKGRGARVCAHCDIEIMGKGFETSEGVFCSDRCYIKSEELKRIWREREEAYIGTINAIVTALDVREHGTGMHSQRVSKYTEFLARKAGFSEEECKAIRRGALLHDIGKIGIPDAVLLKRGALTEQERDTIKNHPEMGRRILTGLTYLRAVASIVYAHHERFDGSGYPLGLKGKDIPAGARLFAIADTLDAITSDRPYHVKKPFAEACAVIESQSGRDFDPEFVSVLLAHAKEFREIFHL